LGGREAVVTQAIGTGLDIVDAEYQRVESKNVHGYHSIEIMFGAGQGVAGGGSPRLVGRSTGAQVDGWPGNLTNRMWGCEASAIAIPAARPMTQGVSRAGKAECY
jgi:hypothetical protein